MQSLRFAQLRGTQMLPTIAVNYVVAFLASFTVLLFRSEGLPSVSPWLPLGMGAFNGVLFISSVPFLLGSFGSTGVGVTTATLRGATLIPVLVSWYAFQEPMNSFRWIAVGLLLPAMFMIRPRDATRPDLTVKTDLFLLALFVNAGLIQTMHKLAEVYLEVGQQEIYKTTVFGTAARRHTDAAGKVGFELDKAAPDLRDREKVEQVPWQFAQFKNWHFGNHLNMIVYDWNKNVVAPYLTISTASPDDPRP